MSEYLLPTNNKLTITEKQTMFSVKNRMVRILANFSKPKTEYKCVCNEKEDVQHIYFCEILNNGIRTKIEYDIFYNGTISEQIDILRQFKRNMEEKEETIKRRNFST